jgi:inner membrane protein
MNDFPVMQLGAQIKTKSRSMGMKLIVVSVLALLMTIPSFFVDGLVEERTSRAADVVKEISEHLGGRQTFLGPTLAIPYSVPARNKNRQPEHGVYLIFPAEGAATVKTHTEERHRSLFKVPVFEADLRFDAAFDLTGAPLAAPTEAVLDWSNAEIVVGATDARGALAGGTLTANGETAGFVPTDGIDGLSLNSNGNENQRARLTLFGVMVPKLAQPNAKFQVSATLRFSGAQRIAILAYGKATLLKMEGDWPNPSFDGGFLPNTHTITAQGFSSEWSVPWIARGILAEGPSYAVANLDSTALGVSFAELADPYQSVTRSLKYVLLFLGLLFLSYFVFEVTTGKRVHPAQYVLVGMAQIIFYLLLLSFAERIGFDLSFLVAGAATVILLSANAGWIFDSRVQGVRALACFSLLYSLIYMLLRLEDDALMVGAIASFLAVAAAMYFTRRIDWYGSLPQKDAAEMQAPSVAPGETV